MKLATIEIIASAIKHPNADSLFIYTLREMGWNCISANKFEVGDKVAYIQTDTVVKEHSEFEFLRARKFRIKPIKLRGEYSNGLILTLDTIEKVSGQKLSEDLVQGTDISELLKISKYEKPEQIKSDDALGGFPSNLISKTDEERIQNVPRLLDEIIGQECYMALKMDGSSCTVLNDEHSGFMVCSRNLLLKPSETGRFWPIVNKYNLREKLPVGFGGQFECCGPGIQGNPIGLSELDGFVFNVFELKNRRLFGLDEMISFCEEIGVPTVPIIYRGPFLWLSCNELEQYASKLKYPNGLPCEGAVIRLTTPKYCSRLNKDLSFKIINPEYKD